MKNEIMTLEEVAEYLRVSTRTVYDWAKRGDIPCGKMGTSWRFKRDEIENWTTRKLTPRIKQTEVLPVDIKSILVPERCIILNTDKKQVILNKLIDLCSTLPGIESRSMLAEAIFNREKLMSTGIGLGIAVPHVRFSDVKEICAAFALSNTPITDYESLDGKPVQIVIMIIAGRNQHTEYIQYLSKIVSILQDENTKMKLLSCKTGAEIYSILVEDQ